MAQYTLVIGNKNCYPGVGMTPDVKADIARIDAVWSECSRKYGGPFLFGGFSIADEMYAPVATRFKTYAVTVSGPAARYAGNLLALPAMQEWYAAARAETVVIAQYEHA